MTEEDEENIIDFITGRERKSVEKSIRKRIEERMSDASDRSKTEVERIEAIAKKDELIDLLLEWKNKREDISIKEDVAS